jgi:hypothetical protein
MKCADLVGALHSSHKGYLMYFPDLLGSAKVCCNQAGVVLPVIGIYSGGINSYDAVLLVARWSGMW